MSALTQLTSLDIRCRQVEPFVDTPFLWLAALTALERLWIQRQDNVELPAELSNLTNLARLSI